MERVAHLPRDREATDAQWRGILVHRGLATAHERGIQCSRSDLLERSEACRIFGFDPSTEDLETALPFLRSHTESCFLAKENIDVIFTEQTLYGFDIASDLIVATKADAVYLDGAELVLREVKTTTEEPPVDGDMALDRFLAISWDLTALAGGLSDLHKATTGRVELEFLTPSKSAVFEYTTDDSWLMRMAQGRVQRVGGEWLPDTTYSPRPGPHCGTCSVSAWCDARLTPVASPVEPF